MFAVIALVTALIINLAALIRISGAQATNRAGLVVKMKDGSVVTRCITFSESQISGYDLLRRSGLPLLVDASGGVQVCKIGDSGCNFPAQQCFCQCQDLTQTCIYWIYYYLVNGAWKYSPLGAGSQTVTNGAVNGWVFGVGSASSGSITPPLLSFTQICGSSSSQSTLAPATPTAKPSVLAPPPPAASATKTEPVTSATVPVATTTAINAVPSATSTLLASTSVTTESTGIAQVATSSTSIPEPQPTVTSVPTAIQTPTLFSTPIRMPTPAPVTTDTQKNPTQSGPSSGGVFGYLVFGIIAVGLLAFLLISRRGAGQAKP